MCVIIHKPENIIIPGQILKMCWNKNNNGAGFMYSYKNNLFVEKGFMKFKKFYKSYKNVENLESVIHFRLASCGEINTNLCHPFLINKDLAVVHNGHIDIDLNDNNISDSLWMVKNIFIKLPSDFIKKFEYKKLIQLAIGESVMVFMDNYGNVTKVGNLESSIEFNKCWFSNYFWAYKGNSEEEQLISKTIMNKVFGAI